MSRIAGQMGAVEIKQDVRDDVEEWWRQRVWIHVEFRVESLFGTPTLISQSEPSQRPFSACVKTGQL